MEQQMASFPEVAGTRGELARMRRRPQSGRARRDMTLGDSGTLALTPGVELPVEDAKRIWRTG